MPYIQKDSEGRVIAVSLDHQSGVGWQLAAVESAELRLFYEQQLGYSDGFRSSDLDLVRVLEDLIGLLSERDIIRFTDFPPAAQKKLIARQTMRKGNNTLNLLGDNESEFDPI